MEVDEAKLMKEEEAEEEEDTRGIKQERKTNDPKKENSVEGVLREERGKTRRWRKR